VAQRLGGSLTAHNRPEGGACFRFRFPARISSVQQAEPARLSPLRILVSDDVPLIRRVLAGLLRADGHTVTEAADGLEAIDALARSSFDLAIVDLAMPGLDGLGVLRTLQAGSPDRPAPVGVLLTASARESVEAEAHAAGAAMVLRKPVAAADLRRAIHRLFEGRQPPPPAAAVEPAPFQAEARAELALQVGRLLERADATAAAAHRTAGLAAQFGWPDIAVACEQLEADLLAGLPTEASLRALKAARDSALSTMPEVACNGHLQRP
jgi:CheY-like chemotaxis protein